MLVAERTSRVLQSSAVQRAPAGVAEIVAALKSVSILATMGLGMRWGYRSEGAYHATPTMMFTAGGLRSLALVWQSSCRKTGCLPDKLSLCRAERWDIPASYMSLSGLQGVLVAMPDLILTRQFGRATRSVIARHRIRAASLGYDVGPHRALLPAGVDAADGAAHYAKGRGLRGNGLSRFLPRRQQRTRSGDCQEEIRMAKACHQPGPSAALSGGVAFLSFPWPIVPIVDGPLALGHFLCWIFWHVAAYEWRVVSAIICRPQESPRPLRCRACTPF